MFRFNDDLNFKAQDSYYRSYELVGSDKGCGGTSSMLLVHRCYIIKQKLYTKAKTVG